MLCNDIYEDKIKRMLNNDYQFQIKDLEEAFLYFEPELIKELLNKKLIPNSKCFVNFIKCISSVAKKNK